MSLNVIWLGPEALLLTNTLGVPDTLVPHFEKLWDGIPEMHRGRGRVPTGCRVSLPMQAPVGSLPSCLTFLGTGEYPSDDCSLQFQSLTHPLLSMESFDKLWLLSKLDFSPFFLLLFFQL